MESLVHGCNHRKNDKHKSPCCPAAAGCKYGDMARAHDRIAKRVKAGIEYDYEQGASYDFGIENPRGALEDRDYMQPNTWKTPLHYRYWHCCAYKPTIKAKKPMMLATSMDSYFPEGTTGNGLCNNGKCGNMVNGSHIGQLGRHPRRGPRGIGATKLKNAYPEMWAEEYLRHAMDRAAKAGRQADIVVDIGSGWQSLKPVCQKLGLRYIGMDIQGDRNINKRTNKTVDEANQYGWVPPTDEASLQGETLDQFMSTCQYWYSPKKGWIEPCRRLGTHAGGVRIRMWGKIQDVAAPTLTRM